MEKKYTWTVFASAFLVAITRRFMK